MKAAIFALLLLEVNEFEMFILQRPAAHNDRFLSNAQVDAECQLRIFAILTLKVVVNL